MPMVLAEVEKVRGADERAAIFTKLRAADCARGALGW
jgi:hypothetical protein